jgi:hypothetical protein
MSDRLEHKSTNESVDTTKKNIEAQSKYAQDFLK